MGLLSKHNVKIINDSFLKSEIFINNNSFVYLDPPYRPITKSSSFTNYSKNDFGDKEQIELANYYKRISKKQALVLLSNSDPKNTNPEDNFFDNLYSEFNIERVPAKRSINSDGEKRGVVMELLIKNY